MDKSFLVDISFDKKMPEYNLILCKMNEEQIQEINNDLIDDLECKFYFTNIDEISFKIPYRISDNELNYLYNLIDGNMMILLNDLKYFILTKPEIKTNEQTGEIYKSITGFSREYEFAQKKIIGYSAPSRKIYDELNELDENELEIGFLNYALKNAPSWSIGYISSNTKLKYRELNFSKSTYLQAFQEIQKTFNCVFQYDTINKIINVYDIEQLGHTSQGLYISDGNFIKSLTQTINYDEVKTRLYLYGKDNISIQSINIVGQPYIENYDFFKNEKYMTQGLIDALNEYENFIENKQGEFQSYLNEVDNLNEEIISEEINLRELETELKVIQSDLDIAISEFNSGEITLLKEQEEEKLDEIESLQSQIDDLEFELQNIYISMQNLKNSASKDQHFTIDQLNELDSFVREDDFTDANYTEENLDELLEDGTRFLKKISYPNLQFNIEVEDFLNLVEGQHIWDKLISGSLVIVEHEELGIYYEVRLVGYTHSPDANKLNLIFSNKNSVDDANIYLGDLLESLTTTTSTVDFNKFKWNKGDEANSAIVKYINSNLDLSKQQVIKAEGQFPMMDDRGFWLTKINPDNSVDMKQLRIVNNAIVMTADNWDTLEWALTAEKGINANIVSGKLGNFARVNAEQIVVGDWNGEAVEDGLLDYVVTQHNSYNGVKINATDGIKVIRSDNLVQSTLNATEGMSIESRNSTDSPWSKNFYVDSNGKIQAKNIEIDGSGKFKGEIEADSGHFKGSITGATGTFSGIVDASDYRINGNSILTNNKIKDDYIDSLTANKITAGTINANVVTISNLVVGDNVTMGENASISWSQVTSQPNIPSQYTNTMAVNAFKNTYIDSNNVFTGNIYAHKITGEEFTALNRIQIGGRDNANKSIIMYTSAGVYAHIRALSTGVSPILYFSAGEAYFDGKVYLGLPGNHNREVVTKDDLVARFG